MNTEAATRATTWLKLMEIRCLVNVALIATAFAMTGCAAPPLAPASAPDAAAVTAPTRIEKIEASLKAMSFEKRDDGWYLSLPAPLVFPFDSDAVGAEARENLIKVARELRTLGIDHVLVRGHTDAVGAREYNLALSKRRADAVARVFADGGYPVEGIDAKGMGSAVPVGDNATVDGRARNRRVVIIVQVPTTSA